VAIENVVVYNGTLSNYTVAVDTTAQGEVQLVKLAVATDGSSVLLPGDATNGLLVNHGANNAVTVTSGTVATTNTGTFAVQVSAAVPAGANEIGRVRITDGTDLALVTAAGSLAVDGSGVTQPISGTVTANAGTGPWPITDNAGSLTVDGTVTVNDGAGSLTVDNAGTFAVQADTELVVFDTDTGAGVANHVCTGILLAASGGPLLVGAANPMPVSGSFTSTAETHTYANGAIVAVINGSVQVSLIAAGTRKGVYFQNQGTLPVYIGKTGLTASAHILKLDPGVLVEIFENLGVSSPAWFGIEHSGDVNVLAGGIT